MKQILTFVFFVAATTSFATLRTVSNNPATVAQHSTIQAAITASSSGDSIYVHGSPNSYAAFTMTNIRLTILGPGWSPDKNQPFVATVNGCTITGTGCDNSEFHGLVFNSTLSINSNSPDGLKFIRNQFANVSISINQNSTTYSNYLFESNFFDNASIDASTGSTYENFLIQNNDFVESGCCRSGNINGFNNSVNVLVNHNLFYGGASGTRDVFSNVSRFLIISNNIFVRRNAATNNSSSSFSNNITFNAGNNTPWASNSNVDGGGNVANQDPQMVDQTAVNTGVNNPLNNFTIAAGPANDAGSDGKDMGLLYDANGSLNWSNARNSRLPRIFSMNIASPTVPAGGTLQVTIDARRSN
jgi:hypothetical protein